MMNVEEQNQAVIFKKASFPVTLKFEEVVYKIKVESSSSRVLNKNKGKISNERVILNGISGTVLPGEMLAILGPSGSGKTTLLTALGGRQGDKLGGSVHYNGKPFSNSMKRNTGFVTQDDIMHPHLTVTETLVYTALLRLPRTMSKAEKKEHAEAVILQLGLTKCKNSIVGGTFIRGVSGGERKRVSIGQELLINPSLLFLDEPTSGLDSTTAQKIVSTLWDLANGGRTVLMTIHQPSSRLFYMFHKILLLSDGNPLYFGKGSNALNYFSSIGFAPDVAMNPSDFLLDIANGVLKGEPNEDQAGIKQTLVSAYTTHLSSTVKAEDGGGDILFNVDSSMKDKKVKNQWPNSWWDQFSVLVRRGFKERKHDSFSTLRIVEVLVVSLLSGLMWWQSPKDNIQDQAGLLFFYVTFWGYYPLFQAIFTFPHERLMLTKERASGMYRLSAYFMAITLGELPMDLVLPTVFYAISYWMTGLKSTPAAFFSGLFVLLYNVIASQSVGLALGSVVLDQKKATTLGSVLMLVFTLTSGFYVQHVPMFIGWIKYLSVSLYSFKLMLSTQFTYDQTYRCSNGINHQIQICLVRESPMIKAVGLGGNLTSVLAMAIMVVFYRVISYLALTRLGVIRK